MSVFLSVRFSPFDARTYTYVHNGPEPIEPGSFVMVETTRGAKRVEVVAVGTEESAFPCKAITGVCPAEDVA